MNRLQGEVTVITGGSSGFGYSIAELFAREGANVMIASRGRDKGTNAAKKISEVTGASVGFFPCDVSKEREVKELIRETMNIYGRIGVLVNNAGTTNRKDFEETTEEEYDYVMETNLKGTFFCCKHTIPLMIKSGKGSIINISSNTGLVGRGDVPVYSASKGGLILMTKSLALRYAKNSIRVNCICPGFIITDHNRDVIEKAPDPTKKLKELESTYPLRRLGTPIDVAYAAVYLASDESQWVTGIALPVDGGYTAG